ncbi:MAG: alpha/beta hydrolase [Candidatus Peribacteraceae bacterium]|nr:alpha/beta hydrolase [Candidatus Peribacteraceae bacterium]MDD5074893.1 alpha/beta hydrolase [Candidatus Peribacteraceae bacterium]
MSHILLCLHGWGGSKESFTELRAALAGSDSTILTPDLPGFGTEPEPSSPFSVDDYADWAEHWLAKQLSIVNDPLSISLLGHSHGGRIAIKLAVRKKITIDHLYLCAAAGIRHPSFKRSTGAFFAKIGKAIFALPLLKSLEPPARKILYKLLREHDYERASPMMQRTHARVTSEDLTPLLPAITVPTDIFWGENDTMTPVADGRTMHDLIKGSVLHTFPGVRHRVHRDRAAEISAIIRNHL